MISTSVKNIKLFMLRDLVKILVIYLTYIKKTVM